MDGTSPTATRPGEPSKAGLSKVFSIGYEFIRRLRAFQTERAISAMRIPAAAAAGLMCMANSPFCFDLVPAVADTGCAVADAGDGRRDLLYFYPLPVPFAFARIAAGVGRCVFSTGSEFLSFMRSFIGIGCSGAVGSGG